MADNKLTEITSAQAIVDTDLFATVQDVATTPVTKAKTMTLLEAYLKTYFDTLYTSTAGWHEVWFPIAAFTPLNTNGCGSLQELDGQKVRAFSPTTDQFAVTSVKFPTGWTGNIKGKVEWLVGDTNTGNVVWEFLTENAASGEVMGNPGTLVFDASAAGGTLYQHTTTDYSGTLAAGADGEVINLVLGRDQDHANETYAGTAYAYGVMIAYEMG